MPSSESEILEKIAPFSQQIQNCIKSAVNHYQVRLSDESNYLTQTTISSYIRDFIIRNIKETFLNQNNVSVIQKRGMIVLRILSDPIISLKFKKFNRLNRISCARTVQAQDYSFQYNLFGDALPPVNLHAGYKWKDETCTEIDCLIGFPNGLRTHEWVALISDSGNMELYTEVENINEIIEIPKPRIKTVKAPRTNEKTS